MIKLKELISQKPRCSNCGKLANYFLHGSWVCTKCYPHGKWNTQKAKKIRAKRRELFSSGEDDMFMFTAQEMKEE